MVNLLLTGLNTDPPCGNGVLVGSRAEIELDFQTCLADLTCLPAHSARNEHTPDSERHTCLRTEHGPDSKCWRAFTRLLALREPAKSVGPRLKHGVWTAARHPAGLYRFGLMLVVPN